MNEPILVPLDGSELAERALPFAASLARASSRRMLLVRVLVPKPPRGEPLIQESQARAELDATAERLRAEGLVADTVLTSTLFGEVAELILKVATDNGCSLIVMSTHGRGGFGRWLYGSVAEPVMREASIPVLLVPAAGDHVWPPSGALRVLVPFDGSDQARNAIQPMLASMGASAASNLLLQIVTPLTGPSAEMDQARESLDPVEEELRGKGRNVGVQVVFGPVAASIARVAREEQVDIIAMATHGRSGLARLVLGSIAAETLHRTRMPMLMLRPAALQQVEADQEPATQDSTADEGPLSILVCLDLTDKANAALGPTARLAGAAGARVVLLNVIRPITDLGHVVAERPEALEYVQAERRMYLQQKAEHLRGIDVETRVEVLAHGEDIEHRIATVAAEIHADVVVAVSKRVPGASSVILGSFTQGILRLSPCPVLIVSP
jgi:nucleotide-binding universal stress UspA family protein